VTWLREQKNDKSELVKRTFREPYRWANGIVASVDGTVYVSQQYGSKEDLTEISATYPFTVSVNASLANPEDIEIDVSSLQVDTSSWYE
jgi:hypothetical protein